MKRCPSCQSTYTDDTLNYCLQDGVPLITGHSDGDEGPETVLRVPVAHPSISEPTIETKKTDGYDDAPTGRSKAVPILIAAMFALIVAAGGIGYFIYLNIDGRSLGATSSTVNSNNQTEQPTPLSKQAAAKMGVEKRVRDWTAAAEARRIELYMEFYADRLRYYNKKDASKAFVKADKKKAFEKYSKIEIKISNLAVKISDDFERAAVELDKEWSFSDGKRKNTGKVRSHVEFRMIGGIWKIVAERDAKVYYVNKG